MSNRPFRFVHASDFHLELPPGRVTEVPEHLKDLFLDAASMAAERVFETVISEEADFLVLSGDIIRSQQASPRALLFLVDQFKRLAQRGIAVYWGGGCVDPPEAWPTTIPLPDNVHVFPRGHVDEFLYRRDGDPLARILGTSRDGRRRIRPTDLRTDRGGPFTITVAHGLADVSALRDKKGQGADYWALGGRHDRNTLFNSPSVAHYCGSPQGRCPGEHGTHGCTLVQVDGDAHARTVFFPTDVLRWVSERVEIDDTTSREDLEATLRSRMQSIVEMASSIDRMISWTIAGSTPEGSVEGGSLLTQLRREALGHELLDGLRTDFGHASPAAWSVSLEAELPEVLPAESYEQDTIRGDFLRAVRQYQMNDDMPIELDPYMAESHVAGTLGSEVALTEESPHNRNSRDRALRTAAMLGLDLLGGGYMDCEAMGGETIGGETMSDREDQS